jgi:hypothetical protein
MGRPEKFTLPHPKRVDDSCCGGQRSFYFMGVSTSFRRPQYLVVVGNSFCARRCGYLSEVDTPILLQIDTVRTQRNVKAAADMPASLIA